MMRIADVDIFYLSYDEPNAEENWSDLKNKAPWAKRVHGVKGFDAAHKACAKGSDTDRFITVDGDNVIDESFLDLWLDMSNAHSRTVFSWNGTNIINGLIYGNGGLKCWTKEMVSNLRSHENADSDRAQVDFCWEADYIHLDGVFSKTIMNTTPYQAFRSGYREGVKMCLDRGEVVNPDKFWKIVPPGNIQRLIVWCSVGADVDNGLWAIYGARLGCFNTFFSKEVDYRNIRDYDWFRKYFHEVGTLLLTSRHQNDDLMEKIIYLGDRLRSFLGLPIEELDKKASAFYKATVMPERIHP